MTLKLPSLAKYYKTSGYGGDSGEDAKNAISLNRFQFTQPVPTSQNRSGDSGELQSDKTTASPPQYPPVGKVFFSGDGNKTFIDQNFNDASPTVPTVPTEKVGDSQEQSLKTSPIAANEAQPGTHRPDGLSSNLLAASKALDKQFIDAGLSLTLPEQPRSKLATSNPVKVNATQLPPFQVHVKPIDWKHLALAYHAHHFRCVICVTAGKGTRYGPRCGVGAALWTGYQNAIS